MKRSDLKVGETYVSAGVGYDRDNFMGLPAILLDMNVDSSRNGFDYRIRRPTPNFRTGKAVGNKVLALMESGPLQTRASVLEAEQFKPTTEWIDQWISAFGTPWPSEQVKAVRQELNEQIPRGWNIVALTPARLWMTWGEFVVKRDLHRIIEKQNEAQRVALLEKQAVARADLENEAQAAGLKGFKVDREGKSITISASDFRNLAGRSLRATA